MMERLKVTLSVKTIKKQPMRKILLSTMCLLMMSLTQIFAQHYIPREEAYKALKKKNLVDTLKDNVTVSKQIISPKSILKFMDDKIQSPEWNSWFFLIDKHPFADWTHACKYIFVNALDASLIIIDGQKGASFPTDILLLQKVPDEINQFEPVFKKVPKSK